MIDWPFAAACVCNEGFGGGDCSIALEIPPETIGTAVCPTQLYDCDIVYIKAINIASVPSLTCSFTRVEVTFSLCFSNSLIN